MTVKFMDAEQRSQFGDAWWQSTISAMALIIDALPSDKQEAIRDRLLTLAELHEERGDIVSEYFARALSDSKIAS